MAIWILAMRAIYALHLDDTHCDYFFLRRCGAGGGYAARLACHFAASAYFFWPSSLRQDVGDVGHGGLDNESPGQIVKSAWLICQLAPLSGGSDE